MTHSLNGVFGFPQVVLALGLQRHGPVVDGTEVGATAGGKQSKILMITCHNHHDKTSYSFLFHYSGFFF